MAFCVLLSTNLFLVYILAIFALSSCNLILKINLQLCVCVCTVVIQCFFKDFPPDVCVLMSSNVFSKIYHWLFVCVMLVC